MSDLWLGRVLTRPGIPREHYGTHSPDVKAKPTCIRKGGKSGGTRAYYPQIQFTPTTKVPCVEKLGPAYYRRNKSRSTNVHWTRQVFTGMKASEGAKLAVRAPNSSLPQNVSTREPHWMGTRKSVQESRTEHRTGLKHVAQRVRQGRLVPILPKNAPEKHLRQFVQTSELNGVLGTPPGAAPFRPPCLLEKCQYKVRHHHGRNVHSYHYRKLICVRSRIFPANRTLIKQELCSRTRWTTHIQFNS